jgi:hypothetical protein
MTDDELEAAAGRLIDQTRERQGFENWPPPELIAKVVALALPAMRAGRKGGDDALAAS